jgi:hypothetical protein
MATERPYQAVVAAYPLCPIAASSAGRSASAGWLLSLLTGSVAADPLACASTREGSLQTASVWRKHQRVTSRRYDRTMQLEGAPLAFPAAPLNELLRAGLETAPDDIALVSIARSVSWLELDRVSAALAPGDRIASVMPNRIDLLVHYLACFKADLVATPLNYRYTFREIAMPWRSAAPARYSGMSNELRI